MAVNYLHIWPRQTFMLIALPNQVPVLTIFLEMWQLLLYADYSETCMH